MVNIKMVSGNELVSPFNREDLVKQIQERQNSTGWIAVETYINYTSDAPTEDVVLQHVQICNIESYG